MKRSSFYLVFTTFVVSSLLFFASCDLFKKDNPVSPSGDDKIELGDEIQLHNSHANSGTTVTVSKSGDQLDGLSIIIPNGSFTGSRVFKISSYEIKKHEFGQYVNPISPLIKITSTDGYVDSVYRLIIPINLPAGEFPLVFIYDENTKRLEPLPMESYDSKSVTIITRHFSTSSISLSNSVSKNVPFFQSNESYSKLFVSSMQESIIKQTPIISSGFKPGIDDWEFTNRGSYISPGGHCAGQTMGALWYYYEKKLNGEPNLFGLLKKQANLWQDNNRGYRFCSVLQEDQDFNGMISNFFWKHIDLDQNLDKLKFYMIAGAMLVTGEPQNIGIYRQIGTYQDGKPKYGGHALICYQIEPTSGKFLISDPNYPAIGQTLSYNNDRFSPYEGKLNADDVVSPYPFITYYAKTAVVEWTKISKRWKEIADYKIGNVAPNIFPTYQLWSPDKGGFEITDEIFIDADTLSIMVKIPGVEIGYSIDGNRYGDVLIFDENGYKLLDKETSKIKIRVTEPSILKRGIYITGSREVAKYSNGDYKPRFIDFKWITINFKQSKAKIIPNKMTGEPYTEYTWNMDVSDLPKESAYTILWRFSDNTLIKKEKENFVKHSFASPGNYMIIANLYDKDLKLIKIDTATVEIKGTGEISPNYGPKGQTILISGAGFGERNDGDEVTVHWTKNETNHDDYLAIKTISWSDNKIEAVVAHDANNFVGKVYIKVRKYYKETLSYKWFGPWEFEIKKLTCTSIQPNQVTTGDLLTITGSGFGPKGANDYIFLNGKIIQEINSWSDTKIECNVINLPYDGSAPIEIVKSCKDTSYKWSGTVHNIGNVIWKATPTAILGLLKKVTETNVTYLSYKIAATMTGYNSKGEKTSTLDYEDNAIQYLYSDYSINKYFNSDGTNFSTGFEYSNGDGSVYCEGKISSNGKILESLTLERKDKNNKLILKVTLINLPLTNYGKYSSDITLDFTDETNPASYISEYYKATYSNDGVLQNDSKMRSASKVQFNLNCKYKE